MGGWEKVGGTEVGVGVRALEARCPLKDSRISVEGKISSYKNDATTLDFVVSFLFQTIVGMIIEKIL